MIGYASKPIVDKAPKACGISTFNSIELAFTCTACTFIMSFIMSYRLPYPSNHVNANKSFDLLYFDIW